MRFIFQIVDIPSSRLPFQYIGRDRAKLRIFDIAIEITLFNEKQRYLVRINGQIWLWLFCKPTPKFTVVSL